MNENFANKYEGGKITVIQSWDHPGYWYIENNQGQGKDSYLGMDGGGRGAYKAFFGTIGYMNDDDYTWNYYNLKLVNVVA